MLLNHTKVGQYLKTSFVFYTVVYYIETNCFIIIIGVWTQVFIPLSKLTYGAYLGGLSIQLLQVASMRSPTYFNDSLLVCNVMFMISYVNSIHRIRISAIQIYLKKKL